MLLFVDFFFSMWMFFSSLNKKHLSFQLRKVICFTNFVFMRGKDSLRSIFMGKRSAKKLLSNVEELISGQSCGQFAKSFREGDKCFIL